MEVYINNQSFSLPESASLYTLLADHQLAEKKGIAVAVNNKVVSRSVWQNYRLCTNDKVTIIHATQGG